MDSNNNKDLKSSASCGREKGWAVLLILVAAFVMIQGWESWKQESGPFGPLQSLAQKSVCAVTLASGQIYYGTLAETKTGYVRLAHVYYVQNAPALNGGPAQFRLLNRQKNDWHGPDWMAIPTDKILSIENVGTQSNLATLISQDQGH